MNSTGYQDAKLATDIGFNVAGHAATAYAAGGIGATKAAGVVTGLLQAAGATAAVPYAGWIAAGAMVTAAGIISLVSYAKRKTLKISQVSEVAAAYGFPQAAAFPDFIIDALNDGSMWRQYQAQILEKRLAKGKGQTWIDVAKLQFLGVVEAMDIADKRKAMGLPSVAPTPAMVAQLQQRSTDMQRAIAGQKQNRQLILIGGGVAALVVVFVLLTPRRS